MNVEDIRMAFPSRYFDQTAKLTDAEKELIASFLYRRANEVGGAGRMAIRDIRAQFLNGQEQPARDELAAVERDLISRLAQVYELRRILDGIR
jgi:hypothetical protein